MILTEKRQPLLYLLSCLRFRYRQNRLFLDLKLVPASILESAGVFQTFFLGSCGEVCSRTPRVGDLSVHLLPESIG